MHLRYEITEQFPDVQFKFADGLDDAIIGIDEKTMRIIYSTNKTVEIIKTNLDINLLEVDDDIDEIAWEYFYFNIQCAYVGEQTPIWCTDNF